MEIKVQNSRTLSTRWRFDVLAATAFTLLSVLTLMVPGWIEVVIGIDPDGGNGSLEWLIAAGCAVASLAFVLDAKVCWNAATAAAG